MKVLYYIPRRVWIAWGVYELRKRKGVKQQFLNRKGKIKRCPYREAYLSGTTPTARKKGNVQRIAGGRSKHRGRRYILGMDQKPVEEANRRGKGKSCFAFPQEDVHLREKRKVRAWQGGKMGGGGGGGGGGGCGGLKIRAARLGARGIRGGVVPFSAFEEDKRSGGKICRKGGSSPSRGLIMKKHFSYNEN